MIGNQEYVDTLEFEKEDQRIEVLQAMDKYRDNKWWLSDDPIRRVFFQLHEKVLILPSIDSYLEDFRDVTKSNIT